VSKNACKSGVLDEIREAQKLVLGKDDKSLAMRVGQTSDLRFIAASGVVEP
jgi:hypothetical protein